MLIIRKEQLKLMSRFLLDEFEAKAITHLEYWFPEVCSALGSEKLIEAIHRGVELALKYRLETERDLLRYLTLTFIFGRDFDKNFEWAEIILQSQDTAVQKTTELQIKALIHQPEAKGYTV